MLEAIHENRKRTQELKALIIRMEEKRIKRQERNILLMCGLTLVILLAVLVLFGNDDIQKCVKKGYSQNYCVEKG